jgi:hypothetical protein
MLSTKGEALRLRGKGVFTTPIPRGHKGPVIPGWQHLRLNDEQIEEFFDDECNIGVLLGEPSGWLVMVDLDCDEAVSLAPRFLPKTPCVSGRGEVAAHYWYYCPGIVTDRRSRKVDGVATTLLELRSTGCQTVVGPSIHPSGEQYRRLASEPASVGTEELLAAFEALYVAVCEARGIDLGANTGEPDCRPPRPALDGPSGLGDRWEVSPIDGFKSGYDVEGALRSNGWSFAGPGSNGQQNWRRPGKQDGVSATWNGEVFYCFTSSTGFESDKGIGAFDVFRILEHGGDFDSALKDVVSRGHGKRIDHSVGVKFGSLGREEEPVEIESELPEPPEGMFLTMEESLKSPGGWLQSAMEFNYLQAQRPSLLLSSMPGILCLGLLMSRKYVLPQGRTTNLYMTLSAPTGIGKDAPTKFTNRICRQLKLSHLCGGAGFHTEFALEDTLEFAPVFLLTKDDVSSSRKDKLEKNLDSLLRTLHSTSFGEWVTSGSTTKKASRQFYSPAVSVISNCTPGEFRDEVEVNGKTRENGTLGRTVVAIQMGHIRKRPIRERLKTTSGDWERIADPLRPLSRLMWRNQYPTNLEHWPMETEAGHPLPKGASELPAGFSPDTMEHKVLAYTEAALDAAQSWDDFLEDCSEVKPEFSWAWTRLAETAEKFAGIHAFSLAVTERSPMDDSDIEIGPESVVWGYSLAYHLQLRLIEFLSGKGEVEAAIADRVLNCVRKIGNPTESRIRNRVRIDSVSGILQKLVEDGRLVEDLSGRACRYSLPVS